MKEFCLIVFSGERLDIKLCPASAHDWITSGCKFSSAMVSTSDSIPEVVLDELHAMGVTLYSSAVRVSAGSVSKDRAWGLPGLQFDSILAAINHAHSEGCITKEFIGSHF